MKSLAKFVVVAIIAATGYFFGQRDRSFTGQPEPLGEVVSSAVTPSVSPALSPSATELQPLRTQKSFNPLAEIEASLRSKLRQWRESETHDPDDDEEVRVRLLQEMLAMVTDENVAEILQSLSAEEMNTPFGSGALHHWMQVDPVAASNWLASRPGTTAVQILTVADDWVRNRDGLKQFLDQLPESAWKQSFLQVAGSEMTLKDPLGAIQLAQQMQAGEARNNLLKFVACSWADSDPLAVLDWVSTVKDPSLREQLSASAAQSYALTDPDLASQWLSSAVQSPALMTDALFNIIDTWASKDPVQAAHWVAQLSDGAFKKSALNIISIHSAVQ